MSAVIELLFAALSRLANLASIVSAIQGLLGGSTPNPQTGLVIDETDIILSDINDPTSGLAAIQTAIVNLALNQSSLETAVLAAINDLTNGTTPVSLPVTPPSGYGGMDGSATFDAVWTGTHFGDAVTPYVYLKYGGVVEYSLGGTTGYRPDGSILAYYYAFLNSDGSHGTYYPVSNYDGILASDTLVTWLTRVNPAASVYWWNGTSSQVGITGDNGDGSVTWLTTIDQAGFRLIQSGLGFVAAAPVATVWPGSDRVTLGSATALAAQLSVDGPMNGVIVVIDDVTVNKPSLAYDDELAYKFIGSLAFVSDGGQVEEFQILSFTDAIYCPKSMLIAARVVVRTDPSVVGTITPWVIDS